MDQFEMLVNRVFRGMMVGADDALILAQLQSEGVDATFAIRAIAKARGTYDRLHERNIVGGQSSHPMCQDRSCLNR